jgi:uncharacterized membrane protein YqjE
LIVVALVASILVGALLAGVEPPSIVLFMIAAAFSTWRNRRRRRDAEAFWSVVWQVRHAAAADRARLLEELQSPKLRDRIKQILIEDGAEELSGDVERFPFPATLRRQATRLYWTMWVLAFGLLAMSVMSGAPIFYAIVGISLAALCAWIAWHASRQEASLQSLLEVTPFRISELLPNGVVRSLSWNNHLVLRNEPRHRRLVLSVGPHDDGIPIDYRRMGFSRLIELVRLYGSFPTSESSSRSG